MNKLALLCVFVILCSCKKEPCFNMAELNKNSAETKEWYANDTIGNRKITDKNGISQTLILTSLDSYYTANQRQDDCGNSFGYSYFSVQYNMSFSRLNFNVVISGSTLATDGFYLKLMVNNGVNFRSTTYDFVRKQSRENNAAIEFTEEIQIVGKVYKDVLKISFNDNISANEIRTVYYSKGYGIIKIVSDNGNEFDVK